MSTHAHARGYSEYPYVPMSTRARARVSNGRFGVCVSGASVLRAGAAWAASVLAQRHAAYVEEKICM